MLCPDPMGGPDRINWHSFSAEPRTLQHKPEPNLDLVRSVVAQGHRFRPLWSTLHYRPIEETFHEFLLQVVMWTFGDDWWRHELGVKGARQHVVLKWYTAFADATRRPSNTELRTETRVRFAMDPSGPVQALLNFGYDLYCLQAKNRLPDIERLRRRKSFQSARYEIAVAAIMLRAGFDIEYLEGSTAKQCEFIARHREARYALGIEAKSRVRPGVLNQRGSFEYDKDEKSLLRLVRKATRQATADTPLAVFVDVNVPPTPELAPNAKQWVRDMNAVADSLDRRTRERGYDKYALLVVTNFGFHFGSNTENPPRKEYGLVLPGAPLVALPRHIVDAIHQSVGRYGRIPDEV